MENNNNLLKNPMFSSFFKSKEQKAQEKKLKRHIAMTRLYTTGAKQTGLEEVPLKDLYAYFFDAVYYTDDSSDILNIVGEISNRVLKKLKTPGVETEYSYLEQEIMAITSTEIPLDEVEENTSMEVSVKNMDELSLFAIFHECKHLCQKYAFNNLMNGFKTDNNEAICGAVSYFNLINNYKYFPYAVALDELDANIFAYNTVKRSLDKGMFSELEPFDIKRMELFNYIQAYEMLKNFKVINGQIDSKLQDELIKNYKQGVADLHQNNLFTPEQLQAIDNLDIEQFFKTLNKQISFIENDFRLATIDYQKRYGINILQNNTINDDEVHITLYLLQQKMAEEEQQKQKEQQETL